MIDSTIFIGAMIIAITQIVKYIWPGVTGAVTIIVAMAIGALVAIFAPYLGLSALSIAQGVLTGLASVGVHTLASSVNSKN